MIYEIAQLTIDPDRADAFEAAVEGCVALFRRARGCLGMRLERTIEDPARYLLRVRWETVENHMIDFRESEDFQTWRGQVGGFFAAPPVVVHSREVGVFF